MSDNRLIIALDFSSLQEVKDIVSKLGSDISYYKVGMELYYSAGEAVIPYLRSLGKNVFLDLKLHDIPNTVARGAAALTRLGASMINVHASGGAEMMRAAADGAGEAAAKAGIERPALIAVTVLTSMDSKQWAALRQTVPINEQVVHLARITRDSGLDGVVASAQEAAQIREACGQSFLIVTPGIRPAGAPMNDQSRITTPADALKAGASHLVIGRPITAAADPAAAARKILEEMGSI